MYSVRNIRNTLKYNSEKIKIIREVELIIIDEISMVRADITQDMYICASYAPKPKVDTTRVDSTAFNEEIILDENGNPVVKEVPVNKTEGASSTPSSGTTEEKKEKKKAKPTEQPINLDNL